VPSVAARGHDIALPSRLGTTEKALGLHNHKNGSWLPFHHSTITASEKLTAAGTVGRKQLPANGMFQCLQKLGRIESVAHMYVRKQGTKPIPPIPSSRSWNEPMIAEPEGVFVFPEQVLCHTALEYGAFITSILVPTTAPSVPTVC
jgi:hypothetical protein